MSDCKMIAATTVRKKDRKPRDPDGLCRLCAASQSFTGVSRWRPGHRGRRGSMVPAVDAGPIDGFPMDGSAVQAIQSGEMVFAIENPGESVIAVPIEPPPEWVSTDPTKFLNRSTGVKLYFPHQARTEPAQAYISDMQKAIFVQNVKDAWSGDIIATVRVESQDAQQGQRKVWLKAPDGREIACVDKPPRAGGAPGMGLETRGSASPALASQLRQRSSSGVPSRR